MNTIRHAAAKGNVKVVIQLLDLEREHGVVQEMDFDDVIALIRNTETEALQYFFDYYGQHYDLWKVMSDLVGDSGSYRKLSSFAMFEKGPSNRSASASTQAWKMSI